MQTLAIRSFGSDIKPPGLRVIQGGRAFNRPFYKDPKNEPAQGPRGGARSKVQIDFGRVKPDADLLASLGAMKGPVYDFIVSYFRPLIAELEKLAQVYDGLNIAVIDMGTGKASKEKVDDLKRRGIKIIVKLARRLTRLEKEIRDGPNSIRAALTQAHEAFIALQEGLTAELENLRTEVTKQLYVFGPDGKPLMVDYRQGTNGAYILDDQGRLKLFESENPLTLRRKFEVELTIWLQRSLVAIEQRVTATAGEWFTQRIGDIEARLVEDRDAFHRAMPLIEQLVGQNRQLTGQVQQLLDEVRRLREENQKYALKNDELVRTNTVLADKADAARRSLEELERRITARVSELAQENARLAEINRRLREG